MQASTAPRPSVGVLFDGDIGERIESLLALAVLYGLDGKNDCRVVALSTSKPSLQAAALLDVTCRFYSGSLQTPFGTFSRALPIGMADRGGSPQPTPMLAVLDKFPSAIKKLNDTAEVPALIRNGFTGQHDGNAAMVLCGPATNLVATLALPDAPGWAERKARLLVASESGLLSDPASARKLFAVWPAPITVVSLEAGRAVRFPAARLNDPLFASPHPVADAWRAATPSDVDTTDLAAPLYAVQPDAGFFKVSDPGSLDLIDGRIRLTPSPAGRHRLLLPDPAQADRLLKTYAELATAKPVQRTFRPRTAPAKPEPPKPDPAKPAEAKP